MCRQVAEQVVMKIASIKTLVAIAVLSVAMTMLSVGYHRFDPTVVGNLCEGNESDHSGLCYRQLPAGGFPASHCVCVSI